MRRSQCKGPAKARSTGIRATCHHIQPPTHGHRQIADYARIFMPPHMPPDWSREAASPTCPHTPLRQCSLLGLHSKHYQPEVCHYCQQQLPGNATATMRLKVNVLPPILHPPAYPPCVHAALVITSQAWSPGGRWQPANSRTAAGQLLQQAPHLPHQLLAGGPGGGGRVPTPLRQGPGAAGPGGQQSTVKAHSRSSGADPYLTALAAWNWKSSACVWDT